MKTLFLFLHFVMILFLAHTDSVACSLSPTAKIVTDPDGMVFYHDDPVVFDGSTSTANCGSIDQYRWQIDDVTVSWSSVYSHTFNLASGESERVFKVQLRVRNTAGKYGYKTIYVTVTRNNKSLYYLTDHLGSVRVTVNEQGDPVGWDDYYPFGLQMPGRTQNASNPNDDAKFTGYLLEQDGDLGIYHAEARGYDPVIGRFMQRDPLADDPSQVHLTPYNYAWNNPVLLNDPDGKCPMCLGAIFGIVVDVAVQTLEIALDEDKSIKDFSGTSVAISGFAGATGVGLATKVGKLGKIGKAFTEIVFDSGTSASTQFVKNGEVSLSEVGIDVLACQTLGKFAGDFAEGNFKNSQKGKLLQTKINQQVNASKGKSNTISKADANIDGANNTLKKASAARGAGASTAASTAASTTVNALKKEEDKRE